MLKLLKEWKQRVILMVIAAVIAAAAILLVPRVVGKQEKKEVITVSTLENIIHVSELSTFTAVYNGIAEVANKEKPEKIDYYVSYEARVKAGIDFEKVNISVDNTAKTIQIKLPEVYITDINVDIGSMDYMFLNDKANTSAVSQAAYKACEQDVKNESKQQKAILQLAEQNAQNILTALVQPVVEQLDAEYTLTVE